MRRVNSKLKAKDEFIDEILASLAAAGIVEIVKDSQGHPRKRNGRILYRGTCKSREQFQAAFDKAYEEAIRTFYQRMTQLN